jgi:hypothetical protein
MNLIDYYCLREAIEKTCYLKELDLSPIPLGFVNTPSAVVNMYRLPSRLQKVGLCEDNTVCHINNQQRTTLTRTFNHARNDYPSFEEACKTEASGIAFNRKYAIIDSQLFHSRLNDPIGTIKNSAIQLHKNYIYLSDELREMGIKCEF